MFSLSIAFGSTNWRLLFKTQEKAEECYIFCRANKTSTFNPTEQIEINDDFGQRASFLRSAIQGLMLENLDESKLGGIEFGLHNARANAELQKRSQNDPALQRASMNRGPSVITPMGSNGFNA